MKKKENYLFEILIIDRLHQSEISTLQSISMGISYSEKLWKHPEIKQTASGPLVEDKTMGITLQVQKVNAQDSAFLITASGSNFEKMEAFRKPLLQHIKKNLHFNTIKVLNDGVSARLGQVMHPLIKNVENSLRSYLAKYHTKKSGLSWWETIASKKVVEEVVQRKEAKSIFANLVETDIILTKCEELGEFIGTTFPGKVFQAKWEKLVLIKSRIAYNDLFDISDSETVNKITNELTELIDKASVKLGQLKVAAATSVKVSKPKKVLKKVKEPIVAKKAVKKISKKVKEPIATKKEEPKTPIPVVAKEVIEKEEVIPVEEVKAAPVIAESEPEPVKEIIQEAPKKKSVLGFELITETDLLAELKEFGNQNNGRIDLKAFVTNVLGEKGYAAGPAYSQTRNLDAKGLVEIYDTTDDEGLLMRAVKVN